MTPDLILALAVFALVTSVTPGPNNLMLLASGVNFGFRRSIPHMLGIGAGFTFMLVLVGFGLGQIFTAYPPLFVALKYAGGLYMLYLAWKIAHAGPIDGGRQSGTPMTFMQAALFQWVNPKAWVMAVGAMAAYTVPAQFAFSVLVVAATFGLVNVPSISVWTLFGTVLRRWLNDPRALKIFNWTMAGLLVLSLWPIVAY